MEECVKRSCWKVEIFRFFISCGVLDLTEQLSHFSQEGQEISYITEGLLLLDNLDYDL